MMNEVGSNDRLAIAVRSVKGGQGGVATSLDVHRNTVANWIKGKSEPTDAQLDQIATIAGVDPHWLKTGEENTAPPDTIPVFGTAAGSTIGSLAISDSVIDQVPRPHGLKNAQHAYALYVTGNSMEPRFWAGDIIFLHPGRPPKSGDVVVVQTQNHDGADVISFVKEYIKPTDEGILTRQYNKPVDIEFKTNTIKAIHRVMTTNELLGV